MPLTIHDGVEGVNDVTDVPQDVVGVLNTPPPTAVTATCKLLAVVCPKFV